jgi:hypothetical protein
LIIMANKSIKHAEEGSAEDLETKVNEESTDMGEATTDKGAGNH